MLETESFSNRLQPSWPHIFIVFIVLRGTYRIWCAVDECKVSLLASVVIFSLVVCFGGFCVCVWECFGTVAKMAGL